MCIKRHKKQVVIDFKSKFRKQVETFHRSGVPGCPRGPVDPYL